MQKSYSFSFKKISIFPEIFEKFMNNVSSILEQISQSQKIAFSAVLHYLPSSKRFEFQTLEHIVNNSFYFNCLIDQIPSAVLPLFNDFPLPSYIISKFSKLTQTRASYIALVATDYSVILYSIDIFDSSCLFFMDEDDPYSDFEEN